MAENYNSSNLEKQNEELLSKISLIKSKSQELREAIKLEKTQEIDSNQTTLANNLNLTEFDRFDDLKNISNITADTSAIVDSNEELLKNFTEINRSILSDQMNVNINQILNSLVSINNRLNMLI